PFSPEIVVEEVAHFSTALSDERYDVHFCFGVAGYHSHRCRLADTRCGEDADALPLAYCEQPVDRPYAYLERLEDALALHRIWWGLGGEWVRHSSPTQTAGTAAFTIRPTIPVTRPRTSTGEIVSISSR